MNLRQVACRFWLECLVVRDDAVLPGPERRRAEHAMWLVPCRRQALLPHIPPHLESSEWFAAHQECASLRASCI